MSIQSLIKDYENKYKAKGATPAWFADLARTAPSRNISINDWNIAMDNIRKTASDSQAVNEFIHDFGKEFLSYYERAIESISYETSDATNIIVPKSIEKIPKNLELKSKTRFDAIAEDISQYTNIMNTLKKGDEDYVFFASAVDCSDNVGFIIDLSEPTPVSSVLLHMQSVAHSVQLVVETSEGKEYEITDSITLQPFTSSPPYQRLLYIDKTVQFIKIYQPVNSGYTNGRFAIRALDIIKQNTTGYYKITDYTGNVFRLPMVDPASFQQEMSEHVSEAKGYADSASGSANAASASATIASNKVDAIIERENEADGFVRLNSAKQVPAQYIPNIVVVNRKTYSVYDDTEEEDINTYLINLVRDGDVQPNDYVDIVKSVKVPSINNPNEFIEREVIQRSYVYIGDAIVDHLNDDQVLNGWKIIGTDYASFAVRASESDNAYSADRINGVLVRFGTEDDFNKSDKAGLYIVSKYTAEELK